MEERKRVWVPKGINGYVMGIIKDMNSEMVSVELVAPNRKEIVSAPFDRVFLCEEYDDKDVDDNCALMHLNEATLLNNLRVRYLKNRIYTYVANILIAINPYKEMTGLYGKKEISDYKGKSLGTLPPHVFAIADKAYRDMKHHKESQSIVVSGESGAGKTESTKYILKYLTDSWGSKAGPIEQRIVESNPLLEAFGNAKTMRNNNSSRFGKFVELHFDTKNQVCGGYISHYLLEKSRVSRQNTEERNFQIFYRLCSGAPQKLRKTLKVENPDHFHYLRSGCTQYFCSSENEAKLEESQLSATTKEHGCLRDITIDDVTDFQLTDQAMTHMGISDRLKIEIYRVIAAILHLGNVTFEDPPPEDTSGGCQVTANSIQSLEITAILLGCDKDLLRDALISKLMVTSHGGRRGSIILVPLKTAEAQNARDALAKATYTKLFDYIVSAVNQSLPFDQSSSFIGLLDIAGFEYFQTNSFEQFCINYCNEKLQQFFNERILKEEQALYEREDLKVKKISYVDNQDCIDLIESRGCGIFCILDEENKLPRASTHHFTIEVHRLNKDHARLSIPRKSKLKVHRELLDNEGLLIKHFAGAVCYETAQFVDKNNDALHTSLHNLVLNSKSVFLKSLFDTPEPTPSGTSISGSTSGGFSSSGVTSSSSSSTSVSRSVSTGKLGFVSVGSKFQSQLSLLMEKLRSTGTSFIRCIKPNSQMKGSLFEGNQILNQLQCSGMPSVLDLMHQGFPSRTHFSELYQMYQSSMPPNIASLHPRLFCKALFKALGLVETDYKFGMTKIFFRPGKFAEFDLLLRSDPEHLAVLIAKVQKWLVAMRWRRIQWSVLSAVKIKNRIEMRRAKMITIQSSMKTWKAKQQYSHRIKCLTKIRSLTIQLESMKKMTSQLKEGQSSAVDNVEKMQIKMDKIVTKLRHEDSLSVGEASSMYEEVWRDMESTLGGLKRMMEEEKVREEEERIKKIQNEMEKEKKLKEEEEKEKEEERKKRLIEEKEKKKKEVEEAKQRSDLEDRKKREEAEERVQQNEKIDRLDEMRILREQENIEKEIKQRLMEQERKDRELALRVAAEDISQVEDLSRYDYSLPKRQSTKKLAGQRILPLPSDSTSLLRVSPSNSTKTSPQHQLEQQQQQQLQHHQQQQQQLKQLLEKQRHSVPAVSSGDVAHFDPLKKSLEFSNRFLPNNKANSISLWSYADLRDTINTSCELDLLEKCREEVHRRLVVYHDWKIKNKAESKEERAPQSIMDIAQNPYLVDQFSSPVVEGDQRYFRISTDKTFDQNQARLKTSGWWLVHFDGNWVARQMELHPNKPPVLLVAGQDDMKLCEYSLNQSGLTKRNGAEILEKEFEEVWEKNGGSGYMKGVGNKISSRYLRVKMGLNT